MPRSKSVVRWFCWSIATHIKDLTANEIREGAKAAFAKMAEK